MNELIVLKLGGSVITRKEEKEFEINSENLKRISKEIANALNERDFGLVIVHGAGSFGHLPAKRYELYKGLRNKTQLMGFSIAHKSMRYLNLHVIDYLQKSGINAIPYQASAVGILSNGRLVHFPTTIIKKLVEMNIVPVSHGDVLIDEKMGIGILSGDHLVPYLAKKLNATRVIIATDVDGIYTKDPKKNEDAEFLREINSNTISKIEEIGTSNAIDVTGGMKRKLQELLELVRFGIESEIISGTKHGILERALKGERNLGSIIKF